MRTFARIRPPLLLAVLLVSMTRAAHAAPSVSLIWTGSTNADQSGIGTNFIDAVPGDTVTLDIVIVGDAAQEAFGGSIGLQFDPGTLQGVSAIECPSPPNAVLGLCEAGDGSWTPAQPGVTIDNVAGSMVRFDAFFGATPVGLSNGTVTLGRAVFTIQGGVAVVQTLYAPSDGIVVSGGAVFPTAVASVPEPSTSALLALALAGLGLWRRHQPR